MGGRLPARTNLILPLSHRPAALEAAGCVRVFTDIRQEREERWKRLGYLRPGDTLVVPSLDRFGRPIQDLISIVAGLRKRGIGFQSLHESLDTTTPGGHLVFHVCAALAEFIRELIVQGTHDLIGHLSATARQHPRRRWRAITRVLGQSSGDAAGSRRPKWEAGCGKRSGGPPAPRRMPVSLSRIARRAGEQCGVRRRRRGRPGPTTEHRLCLSGSSSPQVSGRQQ
ncbi:recombinase family protein [Streptomyces sp. NPDC056910]|uniref:recombinase family protein n=1 Tax=Streptomyces sp. NPDC056910 TaxID=3345964 RepID=UPI0036839EB2